MYVRRFHVRQVRSMAKSVPAAALAVLLTATEAFGQVPPGSHNAPGDAPVPPQAGGAPDTSDTLPANPQAAGAPDTSDAPRANPQAGGSPDAGPPPTPPGAGDTDRDVVYLADGRVLRGTIVEATPNVEVRIRLATGELVTVARREILHFEHTAPAPEAEPQEALPAAYPPAGWVHVEGSDFATLEHATGGGWTPVCSSPCNQALPTGGVYRVVGPDLKTSNAFSLDVRNGEYETLRVHGASPSATTSGIIILAVGLPLSLTVAFGAVGYSALQGGGPLSPVARTIEQTSLLAGAVSTLFGVGLLLTNLSTVVSQSVVVSAPSTSTGSPYGGTISAPWNAAAKEASAPGARMPPAAGTPIFTARF
jgi:hypothetical protein